MSEPTPGQSEAALTPGRAEDATLVARALVGDQTAFQQLEARTSRALYGYFKPLVGQFDEDRQEYVPNRAIIEDLIQKTWVELWPRLSAYDPTRARFATFATKQAEYIVKRYWASREARGVELSIHEVGGAARDGADDRSDDERFDAIGARGEAAYPPPEDPVDASVYDSLLRLTFATASPPHQLIAFGYVKAADWRPRRIAADLSDVPLRSLEQGLEVAYLTQSELPRERIVPAFAPLREKIELRFDEAVRDPVTLSTYPTLHQRIVGETTLADYYTGDPTADITQWWYAVKRRVLAEVQRQATGPLAELLHQSRRHSADAGQSTGTGQSTNMGAARRPIR